MKSQKKFQRILFRKKSNFTIIYTKYQKIKDLEQDLNSKVKKAEMELVDHHLVQEPYLFL